MTETATIDVVGPKGVRRLDLTSPEMTVGQLREAYGLSGQLGTRERGLADTDVVPREKIYVTTGVLGGASRKYV